MGFSMAKQPSAASRQQCRGLTPHLNDWYETIKLNYGFDFTDPSKSVREYQTRSPDKPIPDTWKKWIGFTLAIAGRGWFRCDMSHMVPPRSGRGRLRRRAPATRTFFLGEVR
jgi:hypothetical protein